MLRNSHRLVKNAVDPVPDAHTLLHRLNVDVTGLLANGFLDDGVRDADNRSFLRHLLDIELVLIIIDPACIAVRSTLMAFASALSPASREWRASPLICGSSFMIAGGLTIPLAKLLRPGGGARRSA